MQSGSNETHPNSNGKILNHVNKKDALVSGSQWSQYASYTFEDEMLSCFSNEWFKESVTSLSFLMHATYWMDEISICEASNGKKFLFF